MRKLRESGAANLQVSAALMSSENESVCPGTRA